MTEPNPKSSSACGMCLLPAPAVVEVHKACAASGVPQPGCSYKGKENTKGALLTWI